MSLFRNRSDCRVLVVDDNACNRKVASQALGKHGYEVIATDNGMEAKVLHQASPFDLIFLDLSMPEINGFETAELIRQLPVPLSEVLIVALSATINENVKEELKVYNIIHYLEKPYHIRDITLMVDELMGVESSEEKKSDSDASLSSEYDDGVDHEMIGYFLRDMPVRLLLKFLDRMQGDLPKGIENMVLYFESGDRESLKREAHTLKGNLGQIGMAEAQEIAFKLENEALEINRGALDSDCERLSDAHEQAQRVIRVKYCNSL